MRNYKFGLIGLLIVYLTLPIVAGYEEWGDKLGPVIYPQGLHSVPYTAVRGC